MHFPEQVSREDYGKKREEALAELEREFLEEADAGLDDGEDGDLNEFRNSIDDL